MTVRLHTGEPSIYGAVREQMDELDLLGIEYESCPGVSACFGAAASLNLEYTLPEVSQSLNITRMEGRTAVPPKESIESFAAHQASMAIYLSTGLLDELSGRLIARRVFGGDTGCSGVQGNMAGRGGVCLHGCHAGGDGQRAWHHEDSDRSGGRCNHASALPGNPGCTRRISQRNTVKPEKQPRTVKRR